MVNIGFLPGSEDDLVVLDMCDRGLFIRHLVRFVDNDMKQQQHTMCTFAHYVKHFATFENLITESLNIFNKILIEIYALKIIKVKIQMLDIVFHKFLLIRYEQ